MMMVMMMTKLMMLSWSDLLHPTMMITMMTKMMIISWSHLLHPTSMPATVLLLLAAEAANKHHQYHHREHGGGGDGGGDEEREYKSTKVQNIKYKIERYAADNKSSVWAGATMDNRRLARSVISGLLR